MRLPTRLVIVSRSDAARRLLSLLLEREGYTCSTATDGDQAFEALSEAPIAAVLLDLRAPSDDELLFNALLRRRYPEVGTLLLHESSARVCHGSTEKMLEYQGQSGGGQFPALGDLTKAVEWLVAEDQLARLRPPIASA